MDDEVNPKETTSETVRRKPAPQDSLRLFIKNHYKWLVFVGGLIVSITLPVRDSVRESQKQLSEAMENKENFTTLRELGQRVLVNLRAVDQKIADTKVQHIPHKTGRWGEIVSTVDRDSEVSRRVRDDLADAAIILENAQELATVLPDDGHHYNETVRRLSINIRDLDNDSLRVLYQPEDEKTHNKTIQSLYKEADHLSQACDVLRETLESAVKEKRAHYQRIYFLASFVSYFVIALGVALTVTGQLIGKPGELPEIKL